MYVNMLVRITKSPTLELKLHTLITCHSTKEKHAIQYMHIKPFVLPLMLLIWPNNCIYKKA